jgi:acyl-CoA thioesterase
MRGRHELMQAFSEIVTRPAGRLAGDGAAFEVEVTDDWLQGKAAFGGLQGAVALRALRAAVGDGPPLRALQMTFVAAALAGPLRAEAMVVRRGRAVTHASCTLRGGDDQIVGLLVGMFGDPRPSQAHFDMVMPEGLKRPPELRETPFMPAVMPGFLRHFRQRWAGGAVPYSGQPPRPASMWARLREASPDQGAVPAVLAGADAREAGLVAVCDLPPSPVLSMLPSRAPGASLTWLLELLDDPRGYDLAGWLLLQTETRHAADGYSSQTARVWDEGGRAVAVSHQTTAIFG